MRRALPSAMLLAWGVAGNAMALTGYFPASDLPKFIAEQWDLRSFDSALNDANGPERQSFASAGLKMTASTETSVTMESAKLKVTIVVYNRGDANHDGLEDVSVCYREEVKGQGTTAQPILLTRYGAGEPVIALAMQAAYSAACPMRSQ